MTAPALPPLAMIAAMSTNRVIGQAGKLPWHEPEDQRHFRTLTTGHALIMGRKTFDSLGRPLPNRRNIVVTRQRDWTAPGVEVVGDLASALALARQQDPEPFIGGGGDLYALALPQATRLHLTVVDVTVDGDAWFPVIDEREWRESGRRVSGRLLFRTLDRIAPAQSIPA